MERAFINLLDGECFDFPDSLDLVELFPEQCVPSVSSDGTVVIVPISGGVGQFLIGEAEVACFFEFYEADEEQYEEYAFEEREATSRGLVEFVAARIADICEQDTEVNGA